MFKTVYTKVDFPKLEEEILAYWKENKIFEKSLAKEAVKGNWTFLDGPPFVTGLPHYGHLLTSIAKDLFPRFWTMKGYRVRRVWGWDGHGLPVENKVENKLNIKRKKDIEEIVGVKEFIDECKAYVKQVSGEWEWYVDHIARWVDFQHAYKTWDKPYMESVMWVFKQLYDKKLVYKGLRVSLYCPHCATPISNFEVAMDADNYKEVPDASTVYKYELKDGSFDSAQDKNSSSKTFVLAWSTTPWNKIVVPALAVNPKLTYVKVKQDNEYYILAKSTLKILTGEYRVVKEFKGSELVGKKYVPHYDYYKIDQGKKAFIVIPGDFVTADEGTGVVTIAAYGEEDLKASQENNIHIEMHVDEEGMIKPNVPLFGGMYYLKANKAVNEDLHKRGLIYKDEVLTHSVALCWRCHTRLYYAPMTAWYVNVQTLKEEMKKTNEKVNWIPKHFQNGRFLKSLENAPDWNISRNRYWGSPVPVWECICGERFVPGSINELEKRSGRKIIDLHKPEIDEVTILCLKCGKTVKRVPEVLDSWIEAGSASFGERHYPFETSFLRASPFGGEKLEDFYPPDFIVEYTGQIRAWFYVLHVISNALYSIEAFKNVLVNGVILGTDNRKMSKNLGNYPDPKELLQKYGGDALRLYLMSSPVVQGEDTVISEEQYRQQVKGMMLILWNTYNFFITYANLDLWSPKNQKSKINPSASLGARNQNVLDKWVLSLLNRLIKEVTESLEKYDTISAIEKLQKFVDDFSTWYIRRSRNRVGPLAGNSKDKEAFYQTTYAVLTTFSMVLAPFTPFLAEEMYRNLTQEESVHLTTWPEHNSKFRIKNSESLIKEMENGIKLASKVHSFRKEASIKVRIPLRRLLYKGPEEITKEVIQVVLDEVNVYELEYKGLGDDYEISGDASEKNQDLIAGKAREIIRQIQEERKKLGTKLDEKVDVVLENWPKEFEIDIKKKALIRNLEKGKTFFVIRV